MSIRRPKPRPQNGAPSNRGADVDSNAEVPLRRSEILAIAARHFAEHGFEGTTIRQISDEAGILSGSLYYHFSSKEDMMHELMRPFVGDMISKYQEIAHLPDTPDVVVAKMLRFALEQIASHHAQHAITFNDRRFFRRSPQFSYVSALGTEVSHIWYGAIQQGVRDGIFRSDINIRLAVTVILKLISSTADWYDPAGHDSIEDMIETQQTLVLNGLRAQPLERPRPKAARPTKD